MSIELFLVCVVSSVILGLLKWILKFSFKILIIGVIVCAVVYACMPILQQLPNQLPF